MDAPRISIGCEPWLSVLRFSGLLVIVCFLSAKSTKRGLSLANDDRPSLQDGRPNGPSLLVHRGVPTRLADALSYITLDGLDGKYCIKTLCRVARG